MNKNQIEEESENISYLKKRKKEDYSQFDFKRKTKNLEYSTGIFSPNGFKKYFCIYFIYFFF